MFHVHSFIIIFIVSIIIITIIFIHYFNYLLFFISLYIVFVNRVVSLADRNAIDNILYCPQN